MNWNKVNILITGGTGSFGKKFVEIMLKKYYPRRLIIFSRDELKQHEMYTGGFNHQTIRYFIGDVRDKDRLKLAMKDVDIVVHAAALKQVPTCEYNPIEAILTNVIGAKNVIEAALENQVKKIVAISSDKAVNPINLYGATKLLAEKLFVQANAYSGNRSIKFSCVRYGNVIGSRGSVVPVFREQRKNNVVTVTDPRMTRFWISLEEGVNFVIRCIEIMQGGEIFIPKIPSTNIMNLVKALAPKCKIKYIGLRPGEKIHEVLISEDESRQTIELDKMFIIQPHHQWWKAKLTLKGKRLPENYAYTSNNNPQKISLEQLRKLIEK